MPAGFDIGGDAGAGQTLEGLTQAGIAIAAGLAVGGDQQVMLDQAKDNSAE